MTLALIDNDADLEPSDVTPSDLKAIRLRLGLDMAELAQLLGMPGRRDIVENLEKARTWTMHQGHIDALLALEEAFDMVVDNLIGALDGVYFLIGYPNDGVFAEMEPHAFAVLKFNSVHRMALANVQSALTVYDEDGTPSAPAIVEIIPTRYAEFRRDRPDTPEMRAAWAREHVAVYKVKPGLPIIGRPES
ncbi:helix-turn-helix transcriptional regulator [uncultured Alsobacter sp.]|uniref:helix-turn-helix transcriptional regulator n=1 Tax=uncultured Alsobacter sp. TaxID=1748258 RepID=UPI0025E395FF|nr:helix-turn-helix transcriptional regulator [uncultured Alsobacter sp.]